jgi:glycosyltransferase involved in cell wall biosynthesis
MNIAITSLYLPSGSKIGVGYQVHALSNALISRGHDVTVYSQTGASDDSKYQVVVVPERAKLRTFGFAWDLRRYDFSKYDVLNAHGDDWFLWGKKRPRHVHTFHGSCLAETLHAKGLNQKARMAGLALCEYSAAALADELVTVSENTRKFLPFVKKVIPCGVDLSAFSPTSEKSNKPTILFVGTLHGRKRGAMLLEIFKNQILPSIPDAELWAVCENPIEEKGVRWFGRVDEATLTDLYRRAWVFCLPSSYEGFGVPYIEAMASGTPVVASPNLGAIEVTRNGADGIITQDNELGSTLANLLTNQQLRLELSVKGLQRSKDFGWDRVCELYEEVYIGNRQTKPDTKTIEPVSDLTK